MESEETKSKANAASKTTRTSISDQMAKTAFKALNEASRKWREEQEKKAQMKKGCSGETQSATD